MSSDFKPAPLILFGPRVSPEMKATLLTHMKAEELPVDFGPFGSGAGHCELFPFLRDERIGASPEDLLGRHYACMRRLKHAPVIVVESTGEQPGVSESLERVRTAVATLKEYGAGSITLALPSTAYDRQDRGFAEHGKVCSVNAKWLPRELKFLGADQVVTFTPHSVATIEHWQNAFGKGSYHPLQTTELFANDIRARCADVANVVIGAPDGANKPNDQGQQRARELAAALHGITPEEAQSRLFRIGKTHTSSSDTEVTHFEGDVAGKECVIIDDMSDGGSTLVNAARTLKQHGARSVMTYATHAICSESKETQPDGTIRIKSSLQKLLVRDADGRPVIDQVVFTDTIPEIAAKRAQLSAEDQARVSIVSVGPLLAEKLNQMALGHHRFRHISGAAGIDKSVR